MSEKKTTSVVKPTPSTPQPSQKSFSIVHQTPKSPASYTNAHTMNESQGPCGKPKK